MRKVICLMMALLLCTSMILPAMAEDSIFIPSDGPEVKAAVMDGKDVAQSVIVTSVTEAKEQSTDIPQEERDLLADVYAKLSDGSMTLPVDGDFRYVELSDVTMTEELTSALTVEFEMMVDEDGELRAFVYVEDTWKEVQSVSYNGVDTVTCVFEELCPVVFILCGGEADNQSSGGMTTGQSSVSEDSIDGFVPSITYKDGVDILDITTNITNGNGESVGEGIDECVVVTSIAEARNKSTDISQDDRDLLLDVYEQLLDGSMKLPLKDDYVIKELVDISFKHEGCRQIEEHGHKDAGLKQDDVTLTIRFDLNVAQDENFAVLAYVDGAWEEVESVQVNADGTVTCVFEDICPVAFAHEANAEANKAASNTDATNPWTGDIIAMWVIIMVVCAAGIVAVVVIMKKNRK